MPIDLHHRLSEFSYGYGVTREVEKRLELAGYPAVPFLPSLPHEASLGFDVAFDTPGRPLLLQFKLGEFLKRFRRRKHTIDIPSITHDFWRFRIETSDVEGQYSILLNSQRGGAVVYYVAPKFSEWNSYDDAFQNDNILRRSFLIDPVSIQERLAAQRAADGWHDVIYDDTSSHVLSEPTELPYMNGSDLIRNIEIAVLESDVSVALHLDRIYDTLSEPREIRLDERYEAATDRQLEFSGISRSERGRSSSSPSRNDRLNRLRDITKSDAISKFIVIGEEAWAKGAQLLIVKRGAKTKT